MTRSQIEKRIIKGAGVTATQAKKSLDVFIKAIEESLKAGENITINQFGKFYLKPYQARTITLPNGESAQIKAHNTPAFKPSPGFKKMFI